MTDRIVVDTNVLIVANRNNEQADSECELACIETLVGATKGEQVVLLDASGLIMDEYSRHCSYSGAPGVGDVFFKFLHDFQWSKESGFCQVSIQETPDEEGGFTNLPSNSFPRNARKFLAVAKDGDGRVVNAVDSHWSEHADFIESLGVRVIELCPQCLK
ncbi:MAG: hypothetical protein OXL41_06525 [Nitrospinae bacterium]|nr:hypothetical protein [Nitrospinota bacterium]